MWKTPADCFVFLIVFTTNVNTLKINEIHNPVHHLSKLVSNKHNKPLVVVLNTGNSQRSSDFDDLPISVDGLEDYDADYDEPDGDEDAAYILYHLLRTTKHDDSPDPILDDTKHILRQALRVRCEKVDHCVKKCPPVEPYCPIDCRQVFDNLNLCPPPRPKKKKKKDCRPKCGKTMPPKWRFKF